jgi:hypothetical protein
MSAGAATAPVLADLQAPGIVQTDNLRRSLRRFRRNRWAVAGLATLLIIAAAALLGP